MGEKAFATATIDRTTMAVEWTIVLGESEREFEGGGGALLARIGISLSSSENC